MKAAILAVGSELLGTRRLDTNSLKLTAGCALKVPQKPTFRPLAGLFMLLYATRRRPGGLAPRRCHAGQAARTEA